MYAAKPRIEEEKDLIAQVKHVIKQILQAPWVKKEMTAAELKGYEMIERWNRVKKVQEEKIYTAPKGISPTVLRYAAWLLAGGSCFLRDHPKLAKFSLFSWGSSASKITGVYDYNFTIEDNTLRIGHLVDYPEKVVISKPLFDAGILEAIDLFLNVRFIEPKFGKKISKQSFDCRAWFAELESKGEVVPLALRDDPTAIIHSFYHTTSSYEDAAAAQGGKNINLLLRAIAKEIGLVDSVTTSKLGDKIMISNSFPWDADRNLAFSGGLERATLVFGREEDVKQLMLALQKRLQMGAALNLAPQDREHKAPAPAEQPQTTFGRVTGCFTRCRNKCRKTQPAPVAQVEPQLRDAIAQAPESKKENEPPQKIAAGEEDKVKASVPVSKSKEIEDDQLARAIKLSSATAKEQKQSDAGPHAKASVAVPSSSPKSDGLRQRHTVPLSFSDEFLAELGDVPDDVRADVIRQQQLITRNKL